MAAALPIVSQSKHVAGVHGPCTCVLRKEDIVNDGQHPNDCIIQSVPSDDAS